MTLESLYELRDRLSSCAVAGLGLMSSDERLKTAVEKVATIKDASPVFGKIYNSAVAAISANEGKTALLLDTLALLDAVLVTQAKTGTTGDIETLNITPKPNYKTAPYKVVREVTEALTTSGSGRYDVVIAHYDTNPDFFYDFRLAEPLINGLGDTYSELKDLVADILKKIGGDYIPLLKEGLDPKGKKDMALRVEIIETLCGASENDYYLQLLNDATKIVKLAIVKALRHSPANIELLLKLAKSEKGEAQDAVNTALAACSDPRAIEHWKALMAATPSKYVSLLGDSKQPWVADMLAELLNGALDAAKEWDPKDIHSIENIIESLLNAASGKISERLTLAYLNIAGYDSLKIRKLYENGLLNNIVISGGAAGYTEIAMKLYEKDKRFIQAGITGALVSKPAAWCYEHFKDVAFDECYNYKVDGKQVFNLDMLKALHNFNYDDEKQTHFAGIYIYGTHAVHKAYCAEPIDKRFISLYTDPKFALESGIIKYIHDHSNKSADLIVCDILLGMVTPCDAEAVKAATDYYYNTSKEYGMLHNELIKLHELGRRDCKGLLYAHITKDKYGDLRNLSYRVKDSYPLEEKEIYEELKQVFEYVKANRKKYRDYEYNIFEATYYDIAGKYGEVKRGK